MHLDTVRHMLQDQHWAYQAYAVLELMGMIDESVMKKYRLQIKKMKYSDLTYDTYFIRPTNGHSSPGIKCPASLYEDYGPVRSWGTLLFHSWNSMGEYTEHYQHWLIMPCRRHHRKEGQTDCTWLPLPSWGHPDSVWPAR
eukprot:9122601-Pyramimonas_sp.AAC.1